MRIMNRCGGMVLDALIYIKNRYDPTLTYRRYENYRKNNKIDLVEKVFVVLVR